MKKLIHALMGFYAALFWAGLAGLSLAALTGLRPSLFHASILAVPCATALFISRIRIDKTDVDELSPWI